MRSTGRPRSGSTRAARAVNVARALVAAGHRAVALLPAGMTPGERLVALLNPRTSM
ncbi:hypothetical protein HBB16_11185 [Pseudonocardia sp. MCCB 268]|nr:hypothetical protein [Pseudonocardia cytotoxica]